MASPTVAELRTVADAYRCDAYDPCSIYSRDLALGSASACDAYADAMVIASRAEKPKNTLTPHADMVHLS